jgi:ribosomal protein S18 acetylase RimI-like enzyme
MGLTIRAATVDDLESLVRLNDEVQRLHVEARPDQFKHVDPAEIRDSFGQLLVDPTAAVWVAQGDAEPIGYVVRMLRERPESPYCPARQWWEIDQIGVRRTDRQAGVGRALVQHVVEQAQAHGIDEIELGCWAFNRAAQAAFAKLGFVPKTTRFELKRA